jgi:hypothetical protein
MARGSKPLPITVVIKKNKTKYMHTVEFITSSPNSGNTIFVGSHGYEQKGNRYFWRIGAKTKFNQGFKSKDDCDEWINKVRDKYGFDWRVGFQVKFNQFDLPWTLVDSKGVEVK